MIGLPWFKCGRCGGMGYASIYYDSCTACANAVRFGHVDPAPEKPAPQLNAATPPTPEEEALRRARYFEDIH